jgi:hypothetical protein
MPQINVKVIFMNADPELIRNPYDWYRNKVKR